MTTASGSPCARDRRRDDGLEAAGGLEHDELWRERAEPLGQAVEARPVARDGEGLAGGPDVGRGTSRRSLETSMPTNMRPPGPEASAARACRCGLGVRPKRLSGLLDAVMADGAPHSETGSVTPAGLGLPSTTSLAGRRPAAN